MKTGSLVKCVTNSFDELRRLYGFDYPVKNEILTVSDVSPHPVIACRRLGIVLLQFEDKPALCQVCDKDIHGNIHFIELLPPIEFEKELEQLTLTQALPH